MKTAVLGYEDDDTIVRLDNDTACALATILGRVIDNTEGEPLTHLYNLLTDEVGVADDDYGVITRVNDEYNPDDEDDHSVYIEIKEN